MSRPGTLANWKAGLGAANPAQRTPLPLLAGRSLVATRLGDSGALGPGRPGTGSALDPESGESESEPKRPRT